MRLNDRLRELLRLEQYSDGLTAKNLIVLTNATKKDIDRCLQGMHDTYIDRWVMERQTVSNTYSAVWCIVTPPPDCPRPNKKGAPR